jgi:chromosome segregation ATPase
MSDRDLSNSQGRKQEQPNYNQAKTRKKAREKKLRTAIFIVLILLLWAGLVYGGFFYSLKHMRETERHFADQLNELKLENQRVEEEIIAAMQLFHNELESSSQEIMQIRNEMNIIQEELELTGESITGTDETRQSLQERITELDEQLVGLKEQLRKLEEAARAF